MMALGELERIEDDAVVAYFKVLFQNFGVTKENHEILSPGSSVPRPRFGKVTY
jgi:hypothetical protein